MRFSERTNWNTEESRLARAHRMRLEAGLPVADLTASNPTRCGFKYASGLLDALADPRALDYDPQPRGDLQARRAVCAYYASHGARVEPEQVVLTTSTSEAYSFLFRLVCDAGSEVLVPQPGYPLFDFLAVLDDVRLVGAPLVYHEGWQIDIEGLRRAVTAETRAVVIVHPNNPTGHFTKAWEIEELGRVCREFDLSLIVDEVFLDYGEQATPSSKNHSMGTPAGNEPPRQGTREQEDRRGKEASQSFAAGVEGVPVFVVSGLSKIAGLPQMKAAWIVATGPERERSLDRLEVIADTFLSMNAPVQSALPAWLEGRAGIQEQIRERVAGNLAELNRQLARVPAVHRLKVEAGWYAVLRIPALAADEDTVLALLERGVWAHAGYFFGFPESGWLVVSLLAESPEFSTGVTLLVDYFATNQNGNATDHSL